MQKYILVCFLIIISLIIAFGACKKNKSIDLTSADFVSTTSTNTPIIGGPTFTRTSTSTPTLPPPCVGELLDNMDDNDNQNNWGGYWYTYDDLSNNGSSYVVPWSETRWDRSGLPKPEQPFYMQSPGRTGSGYAARMTGYVTTQFTYGFVGMGSTFLDPKTDINISECVSIRFWHKGDGKEYRMKISSAHTNFLLGEADNHYGRKFTTTSNWQLEDIPLIWLTQEPYWGTTVNLNDAMSRATDIQFQSVGQPLTSIDLWVDEIQFCGCNLSYMMLTPTPAITPGLIDNMEDGDAQNQWGGYWYTYDDSDTTAISYIVPRPAETFVMQGPGRYVAERNTYTAYAARITGNVSTYPFPAGIVGMGTVLRPSKAPVDLSTCYGIKFWVKGNGNDYYMKIASAHPDFGSSKNYYGMDFFTSGSWQQFNFFMSNLYQIGTGPVVDRADALSQATEILFEPMVGGDFELWIDELEVYDCSSYPIP